MATYYQIKWGKACGRDNMGRNGLVQAWGITACLDAKLDDEPDHEIMLMGINSKGDTSNMRLVLPVDQVPALIEALRGLRRETMHPLLATVLETREDADGPA